MLVPRIGNNLSFTVMIDVIFDFLLHIAINVGVEKHAVLAIFERVGVINFGIFANHQSPVRRNFPMLVGVAVQSTVSPH